MSANLDSRPVPPPLLVVYAPGSPTPATLIRSLSGVADACFVILAEHAPATLDAFPRPPRSSWGPASLNGRRRGPPGAGCVAS
ncbi:hypothetical protein [Dactylosporangium cerinum]